MLTDLEISILCLRGFLQGCTSDASHTLYWEHQFGVRDEFNVLKDLSEIEVHLLITVHI